MKILLHELEKAKGRTMALKVPIDLTAFKRADIVSFERFLFTGEARKEGEIVIVEGSISGILKVKCSKCLAPAEQPFEIGYEEQFTEGEIEEESDLHPFEGGKIDLAPYFIQAVMLDLPHVFECRKECQGLCPSCGINRNEESCSCSNERIDPRLADLALFFEKDKK